MRSLEKLAEPNVLVENGLAWATAYVEAEPANRKSHERWRHRDIKTTLAAETQGRCAYCEGYVEDVAYPHVEHIVPKVVRPDLAHDWPNLTTACPVCNIAKGDYYSPELPLLNPYTDDIESRLRALDYVDWSLGDAAAEVTVRQLRLNRPELLQARYERLDAVRQALERWFQASGALKEVLARAIRHDAEFGEFGNSVRNYLVNHDFPV